MMPRLLLVIALSAGALLRADARPPVDQSPLLAGIIQKHDIPGLVAVVVKGNEVVIAGAAGVRKRGESDVVTLQDQFHLGSDTKAMTATLCAMLVEEGRLRWDTTLAEMFPNLVPNMHEQWKPVTLEQLLTNHGGAPADLERDGLWSRLWKFGDSPEARQALLEGVLGAPPAAKPGTKFIYSNAGFTIAGCMAERATGKSWEELMLERLFKPLGMSSAGFGPPGTEDRLDQPRGHRADGTPVEPGPGADNPHAIGPAGRVHCSVIDWAKFVSLHLRQDKLLGRESFARLHTPVADGSRYAMGWMCVPQPWAAGDALTHAGSNTMWYCVTWASVNRDFAVLVACNQGGDRAVRACDEATLALIAEYLKR